jgi:magnesium transporter
MIAKIVGGILPMIAIKLKKDPAVMASPFVTTIVDIAALLIYFLLANLFFNLF